MNFAFEYADLVHYFPFSISECLENPKRKRREAKIDVITLADEELEQELEEINKKRGNNFKAKKYDEIMTIYVKDCMGIMEIDGMAPIVGKKGNWKLYM